MGLNLRMEVTGIPEVTAVLRQLKEDAEPAMRAALLEEGNALLNQSLLLVPVDQGTLRDSGTVAEASSVASSAPEVLVGYGGAAAPYALAVHENPRAGKTGGLSPQGKKYKHWAQTGQWKYLEEPFKERVFGFQGRVTEFLRAVLLKGG